MEEIFNIAIAKDCSIQKMITLKMQGIFKGPKHCFFKSETFIVFKNTEGDLGVLHNDYAFIDLVDLINIHAVRVTFKISYLYEEVVQGGAWRDSLEKKVYFSERQLAYLHGRFIPATRNKMYGITKNNIFITLEHLLQRNCIQ